MERRPIRARSTRWATAIAGWLTRRGASPNVISACGVGFSLLAGAALLATRSRTGWADVGLFVLAGLCIGLRLLCNLFDGMVAVEGGRGSVAGPVWNDLTDRPSDAVTLVCAGYAITTVGWGPALGWLAAVLALLTAYVRVLGGSLGLPQRYQGPFAKQQRMTVTIAGCAGSAIEAAVGLPMRAMAVALVVVVVGTAVTAVRRTVRLVRDLANPPV